MDAFFSYISGIDSMILYAVQGVGSAWQPVAWVASHGAGYPVMITVFIIALLLMSKHRIAIEILAISVVSLGLTYILKELFSAPRPFTIDPRVIMYDPETGYGLPSAHALMSVVILGWIHIRHPRSRIITWGSIAIIILIGLSRIYLGVHYPSQVAAGWTLGALLLYVFYLIDKRLWSPFKKKFK